MKTSTILIISLILALSPLSVSAQTNIKNAFDAILKSSAAEISETHTLERDPATGFKTGQSDIYQFSLPSNKKNLINNVFAAFDKDNVKAYSLNRGNPRRSGNSVSLAVGDGSGTGVSLTDNGHEYIYSLFLAPAAEDPEGIHRYAYALTYREKGGRIEGELVVTYATTLKYRQEAAEKRQYKTLRNLSNVTNVYTSENSSQKSWFDMMMSYFQGITQANTQTRISLATKAFNLIQNTSSYPEVTTHEKNAVREILKGMVSDPKYDESVLRSLLNQCLVDLK